jgi:hypothetical protein
MQNNGESYKKKRYQLVSLDGQIAESGVCDHIRQVWCRFLTIFTCIIHGFALDYW